jgi:hypothetical protein
MAGPPPSRSTRAHVGTARPLNEGRAMPGSQADVTRVRVDTTVGRHRRPPDARPAPVVGHNTRPTRRSSAHTNRTRAHVGTTLGRSSEAVRCPAHSHRPQLAPTWAQHSAVTGGVMPGPRKSRSTRAYVGTTLGYSRAVRRGRPSVVAPTEAYSVGSPEARHGRPAVVDLNSRPRGHNTRHSPEAAPWPGRRRRPQLAPTWAQHAPTPVDINLRPRVRHIRPTTEAAR